MVKFNGAIDYIILKNESKYILFFLDNHNPSSYCEIPSKNIDNLFEDFIKLNSKFIFEEIIGWNKFINVFTKTSHLNKYLEFYNKYKSNDKIIPIDIRMLFDNFNEKDKFNNLDQLFNIITCINTDIMQIKDIFDKCKKISTNFLSHYTHLLNKYIEIKKLLNTEIKCNKNFNEYILLDYPFNLNNSNQNVCSQIEIFLSGLLELYGIAHIEISQAKYNMVYLGASHCLSIFNILEKYYGYRKIKGLKTHNLMSIDRFHLSLFDSLDKSCIDFFDI
jgi:hypothetical protein